MNDLTMDVRFALRWLARERVITAITVLCLGIGIGLNTTIFSLVNSALLRPFDFVRPERLVVIEDRRPREPNERYGLSYENLQDWRRMSTSLAGFGAISRRSFTLSEGGEPERVIGGLASWDLFPMLGVRPVRGRLFRADEDILGAPDVVLLSHGLWMSRYSGDPNIVGRAVTVNGRRRTVVGVMPPRFEFPDHEKLWLPLAPAAAGASRSERELSVFARLKPGVDAGRANSEARGIASALASMHPFENQGWTSIVRPLREVFTPADVRLIILAQMGAVFCVLLIACANAANLMLARASTRNREIAVRTALGASRGRIVRQLLTESVIVALMSGALGVVLAFWGCDLMRAAIAPGLIPYYIHWEVDGTALLFTLAISLLTGLLFGLAPALDAAGTRLYDSLKSGARGIGSGVGRARMRGVLVSAEVALSLVLLVGAALFVRSFLKVQEANVGFDTRHLTSLRLYLSDHDYRNDEARRQRVEDVVRRFESLPGVESAAASNAVLLDDGGSMEPIVPEGREIASGEEPVIFFTGVTAHWFRTLGLAPSRGRDLEEGEASRRSGVAVVNQFMARKFWPGQDPIGRRFRFASDSTREWIRVVGVVPDHRVTDVDERRTYPCAFLPYPYLAAPNTGFTVRVKGDPGAVSAALRRAVHAADTGLPVFSLRTMERVRRDASWERTFFGQVFSVFGAIAVLLAVVGVYGLISYSVNQRTREIGLRMALGARRGHVVRMVMAGGLRLAGSGVAVGLLGAAAVTRVIRSALYETSPTDALSFVAVAALLTAVALLASLIPAARAARLEPMRALREE